MHVVKSVKHNQPNVLNLRQCNHRATVRKDLPGRSHPQEQRPPCDDAPLGAGITRGRQVGRCQRTWQWVQLAIAVFSAGLLACLLLVSGCQGGERPGVLYQQATADFEGGNLPRALDEARAGAYRFRSQIDWAAKFTLLRAEVLIWQGQFKDALALLDQAAPPSDELIVKQKSLQSLANTYLQNVRLAEHQASEAEQLAIAKAPDRLADVYLSWGLLRWKTGDYPQAKQYYSRMLQLARAQNRSFLTLAALGNLGMMNMREQHYDKAIDLFAKVVEVGKKNHNLLQLGKASGNLGWCYFELGNYEKSLELYTQAESLANQMGMAKDELNWLDLIGSIHLEQHDPVGAEAYFQKALAIARKLEDRADIEMVLSDLAVDDIAQGELDRAEEYNHEALELERATHNSVWLDLSRKVEASIQQARGNFVEAEHLLRHVIKDSGEDVSIRWESEAKLAEVYAAQRRRRSRSTIPPRLGDGGCGACLPWQRGVPALLSDHSGRLLWLVH